MSLTCEVHCRTPADFAALRSLFAHTWDAIPELIDHEGDMWRHAVCIILKDTRDHGLVVHPPPKCMFLGIQCRGRRINTEESSERREDG